ncbi:MAG TPA: DNA-binding protein, partial [Kiloniellales bacterium]|nr:DNA-binding protein [Kiloniellales bacterium]
LCVGLLPEGDWREANPYITLPIATGIGKARNVLIAQSCAALVAVGGQYGTLSEIAFGLHFDKPVFGLADAPDLPDIRKAESVEEVCRRLADYLLQPADAS